MENIGLFGRALLQKRPIILRSLLVEFDLVIESLLQKEGVLNSHENLQIWQIAQPVLECQKVFGGPMGWL